MVKKAIVAFHTKNNTETRNLMQISQCCTFNIVLEWLDPFVPNAPCSFSICYFLYSLETSGNKWLNEMHLSHFF